jgi:hypothetical protein
MSTYTKNQLLQMNKSLTYGLNWIINIDSIEDGELGSIYPTYNAGLSSGRIYVALPAKLILDKNIIEKHNIWL